MWTLIGTLFLIAYIFLFTELRDRKLLKTVTSSNRGTKTERDLVLKLLKNKIPALTIFHDLYIKKKDGKFSQIDLVVATRVGILVFEVKHYSGWIFGTEHQSQWTQVLAYGQEKHRLYNPIMQNTKHISDLRKQLKQFETVPFFSIIVFYGDCTLKNILFVPNGTFIAKSNRVIEVVKSIMTDNPTAHYNNKHEVVHVLRKAVENGEEKEIQIQHVKNIKDMLGKDRIFE